MVFQTRHNDYSLEMSSTTSQQPPIPPDVSAYGDDIDGQISNSEMLEWFRDSYRNYAQYFKPILCYLEGTWILDDGILEELFDSARHN